MTLSNASVKRVQESLEELELESRILELPGSARTAQLAAEALGCEVAQIANSLVFRGAESDRALLVMGSGGHRIDEKRLARLAGEPIAKADAAFVREKTGFAIGGVAPVGHLSTLPTWVDRRLLRFEKVWAAAGHPKTVFELPSEELPRITGGLVADFD